MNKTKKISHAGRGRRSYGADAEIIMVYGK
jgi:hypothetical protein